MVSQIIKQWGQSHLISLQDNPILDEDYFRFVERVFVARRPFGILQSASARTRAEGKRSDLSEARGVS